LRELEAKEKKTEKKRTGNEPSQASPPALINGVNIAGTLFENLSGEDLWEKKLRAEGKISDKKLVELIVEKAQDREYEIVAHQKDLIRALKKIRRGYGDIVKAQ
ncbi:22111_t:CDS:2, partial [Racocetra persica]